MMSLTSLVVLSGLVCSGIVTGLEVRLAGNGATYRSGRVEIRRSSSEAWGTVCDDWWEDNNQGKRNADVVCRMLGFSSAERAVTEAAQFGQGSGAHVGYLYKKVCRGTESDLMDCPSAVWGWKKISCGHHEDVGVVCRDESIVSKAMTTQKQTQTTYDDRSSCKCDKGTARKHATHELPMTTTTTPLCDDRNITVYTDPSTGTAPVELGDGYIINLSEGTHTYKTPGSHHHSCVTTVTVVSNMTDISNSQICSAEKEYVLSSSPLSGEGRLDIRSGDVTHRLRLPIGKYKYEKIQDDYNCSTTIKVTDHQLVRRLNIKAEYEIACALLSDPITKSMVISVADSHSANIDSPTICGKVCKRQKDGDVKTTCVNRSLSIMWPTDQTYSGDVDKVPSSVRSVMRPRLSQFGSQTLQIFIMKLQPPVVRPVRTDVVLVSSCQNNKIYVEDTDSCV